MISLSAYAEDQGLFPWMNADSAGRSSLCPWVNATADSATGGYFMKVPRLRAETHFGVQAWALPVELHLILHFNGRLFAILVVMTRYSPFKNRYNSDRRILQPFPALMALILPRRIYLRKVGLEIFKYSIASSVVKTLSISMIAIELPPCSLNL